MGSFAHRLQNPFHIRTVIGEAERGEPRVSYTLSGIVISNVPLTGPRHGWSREEGSFGVPLPELQPGRALHLERWAPFVTLSAISNDRTATNAGWAIDEFGIKSPQTPIQKWVNVFFKFAVRDIDGAILRLGYHVHLVGVEKRSE